jgi:DUF1707 SHOCT-like domain
MNDPLNPQAPPDPIAAPASAHPDLAQERDARTRILTEAAARGVMTLGEYASRASSLARAGTIAELDRAISDIPAEPGEQPAPHRGWLVGIFGGTEQRGRWRLGHSLRIVCVFGGVRLDLGSAQPQSPQCNITVLALLGGADLAAPSAVPISVSGFSLLGGRSDERSAGPAPLAGAPALRVRAFAFLGGVKITESLDKS